MTAGSAALWLHGCRLPQAWGEQTGWRVLDTRFDRGLRFLSTWRAWQEDPQRPRMLHYVALTSAPVSVTELLVCATQFPELRALASELAAQWFGLLPGFHRLTLDDGQVQLTLCVGDLTPLLRAQQFVADSVYLDTQRADGTASSPWNIWAFKAVARCCRRGTRLAANTAAPDLRTDLTQCGFELESDDAHAPGTRSSEFMLGQFNPRWTIRNTRAPLTGLAVEPGTCAVIGAGLAGASVAAALARRGWQVRVLDQRDAPAGGASGLPVGLVVPHVSGDDCALSRLSRSGVRLMLHQARVLLQQGRDWDMTGTLERRVDGSPGLPTGWSAPGTDWSQAATPDARVQKTAGAANWAAGIPATQPAIWHTQAAWLKPAQLVRAWLAQPGITFQGGASVQALRPHGDRWELLDALGHVLARADRVVIANACGAMPLLEHMQTSLPALDIRIDQLPAMHGVRGQLSWAMHLDAPVTAATPPPPFPPFPVNGAGSVVPAVPFTDGSHPGLAWFVGSSYQPDRLAQSPDTKNHGANLARLHQLLPALGRALTPQFAAGSVQAWNNTRCVTADRLPAVGPLYQGDNPTLWICAGMGSRGLSFSVLCAELLAARWGAEPLPVDAGLAQALNALR